ncbi:uncharacterized protein cubi_02909 [Cryptosporidium ubiquitum]|uniref:Uncharacterized protein n=1 Tax=Cryptosporidium ubiquitum TaxID=857276 RepID=A0A1J4MKY0_9CRYT|nr:uncharacterized protein cubi_02909 [Cryptosporidium ubiquitum]OII74107.1 hypothetical protein cubi_02909 [Cryptosporidium ubiquitum]
MHHKKLICLFNLLAISSIFIVCLFLINSVETQTPFDTNLPKIEKKYYNNSRISPKSTNRVYSVGNSTIFPKDGEKMMLVRTRENAPAFKGNIYVRNNEDISEPLHGNMNIYDSVRPVDYYSFLGNRFNLMNDQFEIYNSENLQNNKTEYKWMNDKYSGPNKNNNFSLNKREEQIHFLLNKGVSVSIPNNTTIDNEEFNEFVVSNLGKSNKTQFFDNVSLGLYKNNDSFKYSGFKNRKGVRDTQFRNKVQGFQGVMNITLSNSDPVELIQEKDNLLPNIKWDQDVLSEIPSNIPEKIVNFEYQHTNEEESNELDGKEGALLKEFVRLAVDFSFLSGSSLNGAVCMYKAVLPLIKIRWKTLNSINTSRMDTIVKVMLGIPFFRYFEEKENMISSCINMFFAMDMDSGEGLCINKSGYEGSIMGISIADFKIHQYYDNKSKIIKEKRTKKENNEFRPHDSANLLEMIYDDICNYFYECMDEDISDELNEYILQNAHIFSVSENQIINFFKVNQSPLFPETSERKSSIDALPSDWFLAALQQLSQMNTELPELAFPGLNIRDLGRLYFYSGRLGVQLPIRITLKMIYELSMFANHSSLLRIAFCTESLLKVTNFKIANALCRVSFSPIPLKFDPNKLYTSLKELLKMISFAPASWKKRPDPICSEAELAAEKYPNVIYPPDFIQYYVMRDKWSLYRSLAVQLYGNLAIENGESFLSIVSMIHSLIVGYIKLNWDEFKKLYVKVGIVDPEKYYSLLLSQHRGPALIELIAFSRIYNIKIKVYKKVLKNSRRVVHFELDEEITEIIQQLNSVDHSYNEGNNTIWNEDKKTLSCKAIRLLLKKEQPPGFSQGVFKKNILNLNENIHEEVKDGSNWIWDAILPVYDAETNEKILSNEIGLQIKYKTILGENSDSVYEFLNIQDKGNNTFPLFEIIQDEVRNYTDHTTSWRKPSNHSFGHILVSGIKTPIINGAEKLNNKQSEFQNKVKINNAGFQSEKEYGEYYKKYYRYYIIVQPLISFHQAGVYESRIFTNKVFKYNPYFDWDNLPNRLDLEYLQSIIYVGDIYKEKKSLEIDSWRPIEQKNNTTNIFPASNLNKETDREDSEADKIKKEANITLNRNVSKTSFDKITKKNFTLLEEYNSNFVPESRAEMIKIGTSENEYLIQTPKPYSLNEKDMVQAKYPDKFASELDYIIIPTLKPWNNFVNLPKVGVMTSEPEFSFIPLKDGSLLPNKAKEKNNVFKLDMEILFNLAKEFWMLPLFTVSRALYCFGKNIAPFLNNPNPSYIPQMLIYDRIISTVVSLLPVVDTKMNNLRPIQFVITVCEMALLDPIDLDPFLNISKNSIYSSQGLSNNVPNDLMRIFGQMPAIRNICASVANCIHLSNYGNEYKNLINKVSRSEVFNRFTPSSEQIILIQKLVPRFPEVVIIIRNLLRIIYFMGRKGISFTEDALYQIAKELSIAFHSISPYIWRSQINLQQLYEMVDKPAGGLREARRMERNYSFVPVYEEAYWRLSDRELLLFTCASILTSRGILTLIAAIVVCHYSFLRIPLSKKIVSTIPDQKDLENDERLARETTFFFLRDFVKDPIELIKSKEYNEDPMGLFTKIYSEWQDQNIREIGTYKEKIKEMFNKNLISLIFIRYDAYIDLLLDNGEELERTEIKFERFETDQEVYNSSKLNYKNHFSKESFYNNNVQSEIKGFFRDRPYFEEKFSSFWGYRPSPYKKDLRKSQKSSSIDDLFESLSLLLYSTNSYKHLIKVAFTSSLSLIKKTCELEHEIIRNSKSKNAYIHVEGVDQEVVLFVLSICNQMRVSREKAKSNAEFTKSPENRELDNINHDSEMHHLEIFEVMQFIYKIPIMVFEMNQEQTVVRDTELNRRIYNLDDINTLASSIKIAKVFDSKSKESFRYMPIIPKVTLNDFEILKNGVGPIPMEALLRGMNSIPKSMENRENFKFRKRTAFDDASENFFKRKQTPIPFPEENYPSNSQSFPELVPILRRYIPYIPGDVESKSLLQFIKITTAVIDLRRRPIKELPDKNMEKTFRSILLDDRDLSGSRKYLKKIYGLNIDEIIKKNNLFEKKLTNNRYYETDLNAYSDIDKNIYKSIDYADNPYKFLIHYFNSVRHTKINPNVIHSFIDAEGLRKRSEKQSKVANIVETIYDMFKYTTVSIFSEFYYYWAKFKYNARKFSYDNRIGVSIIPTDEEREKILRDKQISLYIEDKLDKIRLNRNSDTN